MTKRPSTEYKTYLSEEELPTHYYNVRADMPTDHAPMLNPATLEPVTVEDLSPVFATELARQELNAPESAHAIRVAMDEALKCKETGEEKVIVFGLTGTGYFDLAAYSAFRNGTMVDYIPTDEDLAVGFANIPHLEGIQ